MASTARNRRGDQPRFVPVPILVLALLVALVGGGVAGAQDEPPREEATVRVVHGASDVGPIDLYVDGTVALSGVAFPSASIAFRLPAGDHRLEVVPAGAAPDQAVLDTTVNFAAGTTHHLAALGSVAALEAELYAVDLGPLDPGRSRLRVVQGSPDAGPLDPAVTGGDILFPTVDYPDETDYADLAAGTYDLELRAAGTDVASVVLPGTVLDAGAVYDVFVVGQVADATLQTLTVATPTETIEVTGRPAALRAGDCDDLSSEVATLGIVTPLIGEPLGQADAAPAESSFATVPIALDAILADAHAIVVARDEDEAERTVACGEVGGGLTESGALVVGLREQNGSGLAGIAVLAASVLDPATTDVSVFLAGDLFPPAGGADDGPTAEAGAAGDDVVTISAGELPPPGETAEPAATAEPTGTAAP